MYYYSDVQKLSALTMPQQTQLSQMREEFFAWATSTKTDREAAEEAVASLVSLDLEPGYKVTWVTNPRAGRDLTESLLATYTPISIYPGHTLWNDICSTARQYIDGQLLIDLDSMILNPLRKNLTNHGKFSLHHELHEVGRRRVHDCLSSPGYIARYKFYETLGTQYSPKTAERLNGSVGVLKSAFALWVLPGQVILCDKPTLVNVEKDCVVSMNFVD